MLFETIVASTLLLANPAIAPAAESRTERVREASKDVMPFDMAATLHTFRKTPSGGVQRVTTRQPDAAQAALIRKHLRRIGEQFRARDFGDPARVHGAGMAGLREMRAARPDELDVAYADTADGAQLTYTAHTPELVEAVHRWFDAQVRDHGSDARADR